MEKMMPGEIFLKLEGIQKTFHTNPVLKNINLTIRSGEIHCLAGANGSGKSTLIKIISGVYDATAGHITIAGEEMHRMKPIDAIDRGIRVIYQDLAVFPNLTAAENIVLNRAVRQRTRFLSPEKAAQDALDVMEKIGAKIDPDEKAENLSAADRQLTAICRALLEDAKLLILDEPTTALTAREVGKLWGVLKGLKEKGMAILLVDHKLDEVQPIADTMSVLRNGEIISTGPIEAYGHGRFNREMTGSDIPNEKYVPDRLGETMLSVEHLTRKGVYEDVCFSVKCGEIVGITGLLGSGRSEIGQALFGLCPAESGEIYMSGKKVKIRKIRDAVKLGIAYVPEDRLTEGLFPEMTVRENVVSSSLKKYVGLFNEDRKGMTGAALYYKERFGIVMRGPESPVSSMSGGNAQKLVLSKWLDTSPRFLILNGPTVGVDIGAKAEIHAILRELAKKGVGILMISDDLTELVDNCTKILVVKDGKIMAETGPEIGKGKLSAILTGGEVTV